LPSAESAITESSTYWQKNADDPAMLSVQPFGGTASWTPSGAASAFAAAAGEITPV
jgi:hypothetical protein